MKFLTDKHVISALMLTPLVIACEQQLPNPSVNVTPQNTVTMKLNDTGVNFYGQHIVATSPNDVPPPSLVRSSEAPGQDADSGRDFDNNFSNDGVLGFSFTKLDKNGVPLADQSIPWDDDDPAAQWSCVKDENTGLVWEVKTSFGLHATANMYTWYQPDGNLNGGDPGLAAVEGDCNGKEGLKGNTYAFVQQVNEQQFCGFSDWRLPLREEIRTIINYGVEQTAKISFLGHLTYETTSYVDQNFFPHMTQRKHRWTAESDYNQPNKAWAFHPTEGTSETHEKGCPTNGNVTNGNTSNSGNLTNGIMVVRGPN